MIRLSFTILAAALVARGAAAQSAAGQRVYQRGIDVAHYSYTVVIPDTGRRIEITTTAFVKRTERVDSLWLDIESPMRVDKVTVNGRVAQFARDSHTVRVALPGWEQRCATPATARTPDGPDVCTAIVIVEAAGEPKDGLIITKDAQGRWLYYSDHWPNRARNWMPSVDHPSDKATVEWRVHAPSSLKVVANGMLREESPLPNQRNRSITVWETSIPIPPYLMVIAVAPMARMALPCGGVGPTCLQQDVYEAPELAPRVPPGFQSAQRIVAWLSTFVAPFPYEKLAHLQSSTRFGGMENASAIFYADNEFKNMTLGEGLVAHETAHQWFGDAVTEARWSDLWLSEGFATYFASLWAREAHGDSAFRAAIAEDRRTILENDVVKQRPVIDTTQTNLLALLNRNSYEKGGFVLHMLRQEVGDSAWIRGIRAYYNAHKHGNALTEDLRRAVEAEAKTDLKWFFDQWLTKPGFAELTTSWAYDETLTAIIRQSSRFGPYRLKLPVEIESADGVVTRTTIDVPAMASSQLQLPGRYTQRPRRVTFDPRGDVLAVITPG